MTQPVTAYRSYDNCRFGENYPQIGVPFGTGKVYFVPPVVLEPFRNTSSSTSCDDSPGTGKGTDMNSSNFLASFLQSGFG